MSEELSAGTNLSHYRIISKIGEGGMGEVYLAEDTKLDRKVAIKFLHEEFSRDPDKLNRFVQEAKAASALNHPNILTVYEIGEVDGKNYIATELIEGRTLRVHLSPKEVLQLNVILKIGEQVSEALAAAHHAGIIHRDIKPENIMLRKDGYAKVLDFGLAKLTEKKVRDEVSPEGPTKVFVNTTPGMVMGTVSYMSPEQARGEVTDARTDIWSLGVVLYEMLANRVPFTGETINHTIVSILEKEPILLERVPAELQRIVRKALTKELGMRYQSAQDMLIDLKNLRRDLDIQGELERSLPPNRETAKVSSDTSAQLGTPDTIASTPGQTTAKENVATSSSSLEYAVIQARSHKFAAAMIGMVLVGAISAFAYFAFASRGDGAKQISSIAVMPFVNASGNADIEYLSDGMTETLINSLSQIPNLSVKARTSVFRYKSKEMDPKKIASELGVQAILTGRVIQRGDQLTLSVELIDGQTENTIWGQKYERRGNDLVALQGEVTRDVSSRLKSKLSGAEAAKVEKTYTANPEAYQLYLKGRFLWNRRTRTSLKQAAEFFKQAIDKDPSYALAYAGLAETYTLFSLYDVALPKDSMPLAKAAALRALDLDESLAAPHAALEPYYTFYEFDRVAAEKEIRRAIELDPNYATAHQWLGADVLFPTKRFDEALASLKRAEELDPLSPIIGTDLGDAFLNARRYDDAINQYERVLSLDPDFNGAIFGMALAQWEKGMKPQAMAAMRKYLELSGSSVGKGYVGFFLAKLGQRDEAVRLLGELKTASSREYIHSSSIAFIYLGLGEKEQALDWLEKEIDERGSTACLYATMPQVDELRSEPRFKAMLKRLNLPE